MSQRLFFKRSRDERDNTITSKRSFNETDYDLHGQVYGEVVDAAPGTVKTSINNTALSYVEHASKSDSGPKTQFASSSNSDGTLVVSAQLNGGSHRALVRHPLPAPSRQLSVPANAGKNTAAIAKVSSKQLQVVAHVKESDVVHELGEKQAFRSDLNYYFDMLEPTSSNTTLTRSLATMNLSKKLVNESFESTFSALDGLRTVLLKLCDSAEDDSGCLELSYAVFIWVLVVKYSRTLGRSIWMSLLQGCDMERRNHSDTVNTGKTNAKHAVNSAAAVTDHRKVVVRAKEIFIIMKPYLQTTRKGAAAHVHDFIKQCDTERGVTATDVFHDILLHIDISRHSVRSVEFLREEKSLDSLIALTAGQIMILQEMLEGQGSMLSAVGYVDSKQYEIRLICLLNIIERYFHVLTALCSEHEDATAHFITKSNSLMLQQIDWLLHTGVEYCLSPNPSKIGAGIASLSLAAAANTAAVRQPLNTRGAAAKLCDKNMHADSNTIADPSSPSVAVITAWQGALHEACNVIRSAVSCCDLWRTTVGDMPHCIPAIIACCLLVPGALSKHAARSKNSSPSSSQNAAIKTEPDADDSVIIIEQKKTAKSRGKEETRSRPASSASSTSSVPITSNIIQRYDEHHDYKLEGVAAVALCNLCDGNATNRQMFLDYRRLPGVDDPVKAFVALLRRRCGDSLHHNQTLERQRSEMTEERLGRHGQEVSQESIFRAVNKALEHADAAVDSTAVATYIGYFFAYMVKDDASLAERIVDAWGSSERDAKKEPKTDGDELMLQVGSQTGSAAVAFNILNIFDIMERFEQFLLLTKLSSHDDIANMTEIRQHFKALIEALL